MYGTEIYSNLILGNANSWEYVWYEITRLQSLIEKRFIYDSEIVLVNRFESLIGKYTTKHTLGMYGTVSCGCMLYGNAVNFKVVNEGKIDSKIVKVKRLISEINND